MGDRVSVLERMMGRLLFIIALCICSCTNNGYVRNVQDYEQELLVEEWLETHYNRNDITISCPSKKYGPPLCDVRDSHGKIIFRLGCHVIGVKNIFCIQEIK